MSGNGSQNSSPKITNIVAILDLGEKLNLREIANSYINTEYTLKNNFAVMRIKNPKATANIFESGKITLNGTKNEDDLNSVSEKIRNILQHSDIGKDFSKELKIVNISATCNFGIKIDLKKLSQLLFQEFNKNPNKIEYTIKNLRHFQDYLLDRKIQN